jgi:hypothetical protein
MPPVVAGNEPASAASGGADNPAIASLPETRTGDPRRGDGPDGRAGTMRPPAVESDRRPATTAAPAPKAAGATPTARPTPTADTADERAAAEPTFEDVVERLQSASPAAGPSGSVGRGVGEGSAISAVGEVVYELQRKLKAKGYDPGVIDGRLGSRTRQALRAYQQDTGLPVTGEINNAVLIAFGIIS